ncbi:MAG: hypothetical protein Q8R28_13535 [Dehalococcoidia bacterium]|nr:hypothetical protein [Dehalococcoidia bacterium]
MAVRFATNVPQTLIFPFGDFREVQGQHGQQFLYTVQLNGDPREKLYATPALHRELQAYGMGAGTLFTITKLDGTGGRHWRVEQGAPAAAGNGRDPPAAHGVNLGSPSSHEPAQAAASSPPAEHLAANGKPSIVPPDFGTLEQMLGHCVAASSRVCRSLSTEARFTAEDVRCLGITLFLECSRKGVLPEPLR